MTTAEIIISRLPKTPTVTAEDIRAAAGLRTTSSIISAIKEGKLDAVRLGLPYIISRESAENYIRKAAEEASK